MAWATSTYGTYSIEELPSFQDEDAQALSVHFGVPMLDDSWRIDQQKASERMFLQSPAFAALRQAVRQERVRPAFNHWSRGLTPVWNVMTLLSDENFDLLGSDIADAMFAGRVEMSARFKRNWAPLLATLEKAWPAFDDNAQVIQQEIAKVLPPKLAKQLTSPK